MTLRLAALLSLLLSASALAQPAPTAVPVGPAVQAAPYMNVPLGYQQMTSLATATGLPSIPAAAIIATVVCTGQTVNWRDDGTAPTASVGMPLTPNVYMPFAEKPLSSVQFIQTTASATCNVSYYK